MEPCFIRDLKVGLKNINLNFIVLEVGRPSTTKEGHEIRTCKIADRSACIHLSVWGEIGAYIVVGDICRITKGYVSLWKGAPTLYVGKGGELVKTGEFCFIFNEAHNLSDPNQATAAPGQQQQQGGTQFSKIEQQASSSPLLSLAITTTPSTIASNQTTTESLTNSQII